MTDSTRRRTRRKPRREFPLGVHKGTQRWCKKVRQRVYYFGKVADDPNGQLALQKWLEVRDDLLAGREPRARRTGDELTVARLCDLYYDFNRERRDDGEINSRTLRGIYDMCKSVCKALGRERIVAELVQDDFRKLKSKLNKTRGTLALRNEMQRIRSLMKFAFDAGHVPTPINFGVAFRKPKLEVVRREREAQRNEHGPRMFEAAELRQILAEAKQPLKSMILLAVNTGFGATDLSALPIRAVNLQTGWVDFARQKTAVQRKIPLWPETVSAIREWIPLRPKAKDLADAGLMFLTPRGKRVVTVSETGSPRDAVAAEFRKLLKRLGMKRPGLAFYGLRRTLASVGLEARDRDAVKAIMGHTGGDVLSAYDETGPSAERLWNVVETVGRWLFSDAPGETPDDANKLGRRFATRPTQATLA